jgi:hypothetical protein
VLYERQDIRQNGINVEMDGNLHPHSHSHLIDVDANSGTVALLDA